MRVPTGATHQHPQTKRYYRQDKFGNWEYWDGELWCYSFCVRSGRDSQLIKQLD